MTEKGVVQHDRAVTGEAMKLKLGIPKGSLQGATIKLFQRAGFNISIESRSYFPLVNDKTLGLMLLRAQEIPRYVEEGVLDGGITGSDWILEARARVKEVCELVYSKSGSRVVRWVLAVSKQSRLRATSDIKGKRVATELVNVTKAYLTKRGIKARVEFSWGATEAKIPALADAIVELTETGSSIAANNLRIIDTVLESTPRFIANKHSWKNSWKRKKIEGLALLLRGACASEGKVGLKMNVQKSKLKNILSILPSMKSPTISGLSKIGWLSVETIIDELDVRDIIPKLKQAGAQGIIEYPLNKVID